MKNQLIAILTHPVIQILSFSIILVGSPYFGGPFAYFVFGSFKEGYLFGILGIVGMLLTLVSLFLKAKGYIQMGGLLLMLSSLAIFFFSSTWTNAAITLTNTIALITLLLFILVGMLITLKWTVWKNC